MAVSPSVSLDREATGQGGYSPLDRALIAAMLLFLAGCYWDTLVLTAKMLTFSEDMAHGFFAPIVAAYIAWQRRHSAFPSPEITSPWGIAILTAAAPLGLAAMLGGSSTVSRFAFLISLSGCILVAGGYRAFRTLLLPLSLLVFTFPLPTVLYGDVTLPLQLLASRLSEIVFEIMGFSVIRDGNILELPRQRLSVVEACSGLRSLITLGFFCIVYAHFFEARRWVRFVIIGAALPAAIFLNVVRIVTTGLLGQWRPQYTVGVYHDLLGWLCFALGFGAVLFTHWVVSKAASRGAARP